MKTQGNCRLSGTHSLILYLKKATAWETNSLHMKFLNISKICYLEMISMTLGNSRNGSSSPWIFSVECCLIGNLFQFAYLFYDQRLEFTTSDIQCSCVRVPRVIFHSCKLFLWMIILPLDCIEIGIFFRILYPVTSTPWLKIWKWHYQYKAEVIKSLNFACNFILYDFIWIVHVNLTLL